MLYGRNITFQFENPVLNPSHIFASKKWIGSVCQKKIAGNRYPKRFDAALCENKPERSIRVSI
jgi:hypothetical protein